MYMYRCILIFFSICSCVLGGCLCDPEKCHYPDLFQPGYLSEQQERSWQFDPFASPDLGPKLAGDRPHGALDPAHRAFYFRNTTYPTR